MVINTVSKRLRQVEDNTMSSVFLRPDSKRANDKVGKRLSVERASGMPSIHFFSNPIPENLTADAC